MSYEIVYKIFTLKTKGVYIPFDVSGSNNCYEHTGRRERNLNKAVYYFKDRKAEFKSLEELKQAFKVDHINEGLRGGNIQGRFKTSKSILNQFIKKVLTDEDLKINPKVKSVYYMEIEEEAKALIESKALVFEESLKGVLTEKEEQSKAEEFLNLFDEDLKESIKDYFGNLSLFCYPYQYVEHGLTEALKKFNPKREPKKELTEEEIRAKLEHGLKLDLCFNGTTKEEYEAKNNKFKGLVLGRFNNKQVYVLDKYDNISKGRLKEYNEKLILMKPRSRKYFNYLDESIKGIVEV